MHKLSSASGQHGASARKEVNGAKDIPWTQIQKGAMAYVNEASRRLRDGEASAHVHGTPTWDLPPQSPELGSGRWLRGSYQTKAVDTIKVKVKADKAGPDETAGQIDRRTVRLGRVNPNTPLSQRLAKASSVRHLVSLASTHLLPPRSPHLADQQECETRVALDTLSVLVGARRVEFEPSGGRRLALRTKVKDPDPSFDIHEARYLFLEMSTILKPYLERGTYSLSYITSILHCINTLRLAIDQTLACSALEQAAELMTQVNGQPDPAVNPGAYCALLQATSHPVSRQAFAASPPDVCTKIQLANHSFVPRMSIRQLS